MKMEDLSGTIAFNRLILRRDRIILPVLLFFLVLIFVAIVAAFVGLYSDAAMREDLVREISINPATVAFLGSIEDSSIGGLVAWRSSVFGPVIVALVSIFLMIRYTRSEERKGRLELLNSTAVGRQALLTSGFLTTCGFNILLGIIITLSFIGYGLAWEGSVALALSMTLFGCFFAGIAGVAAQLSESSGDARYISIGLLIVFFMIRIVGWDDGGASWLSWLSPLGWVHYIKPFAGEEWWILGLFTISALALIGLAYYFSSIRDMGEGLIPGRKGSARASPYLKNSLGIAWRLHRRTLFFWIIGFIAMGIILGNTAQTVANIFTDNPQFMMLLSQTGSDVDPLDSYITLMLLLFGQVFAIYGISAALKLRSEEVKHYSEFIITNAVSRTQWALSNMFMALIGPAVILTAFILTYVISYSLISGTTDMDIIQLLGAALVYLPAIWVMVGLSLALFGLVPRLTSLSWAALGLFLIINLLADFLDISQWILDISPFTHVPNILVGDTVGWPLGLLLVVAVLLMVIGVFGFRRRDIA